MKQATLKLLVLLLATAVEAYSLHSEKQGENKPQKNQPESLKTWPRNLTESSTYEDEAQTSHVYIVVFKQEATAQEIDLHKEVVKKMGNVGSILHEYSIGNDFRGYSAPMTEYDAEKIQNHPSVKYVEKSKDGQLEGRDWNCPNSQSGAPWGLVRSSGRHFDDDASIYKYLYSNNGRFSNVYVIDSGIDMTHPEFQYRAIWGTNTIDDLCTDDHGHGTHVAGIIISNRYGIAKGATAIAVRTCYNNNEGGATCPGAQTVDAVNWVANQHSPGSKSIINMSLSWKNGFKALDDAVRAAISKGIHVSVSAGNGWVDACTLSPGRVAEAVTVGAINIDNEAYYNYGSCIDINAPGINIMSTLPDGGTGSWSGKLMNID